MRTLSYLTPMILSLVVSSLSCSVSPGKGEVSSAEDAREQGQGGEQEVGDEDSDASEEAQSAAGTGGTSAKPACPEPLDLGVRIVGRHDGCDESGVRMGWSGTGFVARFEGTGISLKHGGSALEYTVLIDGSAIDKLVTKSGSHVYSLAEDLEQGEHLVEVYRRSEGSFGFSLLEGVSVTDGKLLSPPDAPSRSIEVIGDSIACGYGNEGSSASCDFSADTENHYLAFGAVLARAFDADVSTIAWSGRGIVVNYNGEAGKTIPELYSRTIPNKAASWTFEPQPDVVVINVGTNDYSTDNDPSDEDFTQTYEELLKTIRAHYPETFILCTIGPLLSGSDLRKARSNIAASVEARKNSGDEDVMVYEMQADNPDPGCSYHPSIATHQAMADELALPLGEALGW